MALLRVRHSALPLLDRLPSAQSGQVWDVAVADLAEPSL